MTPALAVEWDPNLQAIYSGVLKVKKKHFSDGVIITQSYTPTHIIMTAGKGMGMTRC